MKAAPVMCQILSPERAVIWSVLHDEAHFRALDGKIEAAFFTHAPYGRWFALSRRLYGDGGALTSEAFLRALDAAEGGVGHADRRALRRMFRVPPPPRVRANLDLFARALADRHAGRRVHLERLIN